MSYYRLIRGSGGEKPKILAKPVGLFEKIRRSTLSQLNAIDTTPLQRPVAGSESLPAVRPGERVRLYMPPATRNA